MIKSGSLLSRKSFKTISFSKKREKGGLLEAFYGFGLRNFHYIDYSFTIIMAEKKSTSDNGKSITKAFIYLSSPLAKPFEDLEINLETLQRCANDIQSGVQAKILGLLAERYYQIVSQNLEVEEYLTLKYL